MKNREIAQILFEIGDYLELGEVPFKPQAYQKAAIVIDNLEDEVSDIYKKDGIKGLEKISGIGTSIAEKIEEYLKTGKIKYYKELKKSTPVDLEELLKVEGLGTKRIKKLYKELGVRNLKDLEKVANDHKIAPLFRFGEKTERNILEGIQFLKQSKGRFLLRDIIPQVERIEERFRKIEGVAQMSVAGSTRRRKETIGDVDFLVTIKNGTSKYKYLVEKIMNSFVTMDGVVKIVGKGETKSSVKTRQGLDMDIRLVPESSYGAALLYFTGSKEHNIALRKIAIKKGYKLNEYGLFRGERKIRGETEEEIYEKLGMEWMPPEIREDQGEIEAAIKRELPDLIDLKNIKGDFHCHSNWDGGADSIEDMAEEAMRLGYEYLGISDHTKYLQIENGLDEKKLLEQREYIMKLNDKFEKEGKKFRILQGCEANIMNDGSLDISDKVLSQLDYVCAGIHSSLKMGKREMTERIIKAINNPNVDILNHPTGQILQRRESFNIDLDKVFSEALNNNVALEINASERADLSATNARKARDMGIKLVICTDSHSRHQMQGMKFGVYQARRGWVEKGDVLNALLLSRLKFRRNG